MIIIKLSLNNVVYLELRLYVHLQHLVFLSTKYNIMLEDIKFHFNYDSLKYINKIYNKRRSERVLISQRVKRFSLLL